MNEEMNNEILLYLLLYYYYNEKKDRNKKINQISNLLPTIAFKQEQQVFHHGRRRLPNQGLRHLAVKDFHRATNAVTRVSV